MTILPDVRLRRLGTPREFSIETLCAAIQNDCSVEAIKWYIQSYQTSTRTGTQLYLNGWPALYYAAERNSEDLVRLLSHVGVQAASLMNKFSIPLIAYVIIHGHANAIDTSAVLETLLADGYDPTTVPMDMWQNFLETPRPSPLPSVTIPASL